MPGPTVIGAVEIGGSHVSAALVGATEGKLRHGSLHRRSLSPGGSRDELLNAILSTARAAHPRPAAKWGVAVPGPFDYAHGISRIRGVAKLEGLYGINLREALARALDARPEAIVFLNDADAFLLGEAWAGAARGCARAIGVTLGTGLGSAFLADGLIVDAGHGVPPEGRLDLLMLDGAPAEERISGRGLLRGHRLVTGGRMAITNAAELATMARHGDDAALRAFDRLGDDLGRVLAPWLAAFGPECLVIGGSIARAWDLFAPALRRRLPALQTSFRCEIARDIEAAALLGAARHAARQPGAGAP